MNDYLRIGLLLVGIILVFRFKWSKWLLVGLVIADLLPIALKTITAIPEVKPTEELRYILGGDKSLYRAYFDGDGSNLLMYSDIQSVTGYHPAKLQVAQDVVSKGLTLPMLRMMNIKYVIQQGNIYEMKEMSRAWFAKKVYVASPEQILREIRTFNPDSTAFIEEPVGYGTGGKIDEFTWTPDSIKIKVIGGGFLVLSEIYYPDWKCYIDGKETKIYKTNYLLRGVAVPNTAQKILFRFEPKWYKEGYLISAIGWCIIIGLLIWGFKHDI